MSVNDESEVTEFLNQVAAEQAAAAAASGADVTGPATAASGADSTGPLTATSEADSTGPAAAADGVDLGVDMGVNLGVDLGVDLGEGPVEDPDGDDASQSPAKTLPFAPIPVQSSHYASDSCRISGSARAMGTLIWGSCSDLGRVREHNEDSYLIDFPLFAVADGMGGHAAGEVASTIAVSSLAECGVNRADPYALGAAVEQANQAVLDGSRRGVGRPGMGTTCTAVIIEGNRMAVGHVGDSRAYLLHNGKLLRVTHDHSYVEELIEAGQITPEQARVHPNRSIITRALGSDPNMRSDAFAVDLTQGDRVMLCSDGLSSMVTDAEIEETMVSSPTPQACADHLVSLALDAGGMDNVTTVVVDVVDDGIEHHALRNRVRNVTLWLAGVLVAAGLVVAGLHVYASQYSWYLSDDNGYVSLSRGIPGSIGSLQLSEKIEVTSIEISDLSQAVEERLKEGITFHSEDAARAVLEQYRAQIAQHKSSQQATATVSAGSSSFEAKVGDVSETDAAVIVIHASSQADGAASGEADSSDVSSGADSSGDDGGASAREDR